MPTRLSCRLCGDSRVLEFLDLGSMPHAGNFLSKEEIGKERAYPLRLFFCDNCSLIQVLDVIPKEVLFKDYFYLSSVSNLLREHFLVYAKEVKERFLNEDSLVIEIGSNDGVLLKHFKEMGIRCLGIEPVTQIAKIAESQGIEVVTDFFTEKIAQKIVNSRGRAMAICANNVFAHIDDMDDVMKGINLLLEDKGIFIFEVHYLVDLLEKLQYDMVYNEHLCYYSLTSIIPFFEGYDMEIFDVKRVPIHSGSIRVYVKKKCNGLEKTNTLKYLVQKENQMCIDSYETYKEFAQRVRTHKEKFLALLVGMKLKGMKVVGYGASGRANTLLNYCCIGPEIITYIVDESPLRQGRYTPGMHIPIVFPDVMRKDNVDVIVLFAWSYYDEIVKKEKDFIEKGGKFIIPLPTPRISP